MESKVRLERIFVKELFGSFTYDIDLNNGNSVAILAAPNGCGKTTIFNLVDFIFNPNITKLRKISAIPFKHCICTLSNGKQIRLERELKTSQDNGKKGGRPTNLYHEMLKKDAENANKGLSLHIADDVKVYNYKGLWGALERLEDLEVPSFDAVLDKLVNSQIDSSEKTAAYMQLLYQTRHGRDLRQAVDEVDGIKTSLAKQHCDLSVNFIPADRLQRQDLTISKAEPLLARSRFYEGRSKTSLQIIQERASALYRKADTEYKRLVSEALNAFPKEFLNAREKPRMSFRNFSDSWKEYILDLEKYHALGLVESTHTIIESDELEDYFSTDEVFLTVYLDVFKSTLEPWEKEYERLKLFADIINRRNRITRKELKYGPDGIIMQVKGQQIMLENLSSGEKNDLIMFYNLIFTEEKGGLILIDEPEISLHIEWQEEYLDRLLDICRMNELQAIVATHSPNIVNGHFELYAEKGITR